jgi:two-component system sensor histidine kinase DesK
MNKIKRALSLPWAPVELGKMPYLWAFSLLFFLWKYLYATPGVWEVVALVLTVLVFLPIYFVSFWGGNRQAILCCLLTCLLGTLWAPYNQSTGTLFIFACGMSARIQPARSAYRMLGVVLALAVVDAFLLTNSPSITLLPVLAVGLPVGIATVMESGLRRSRQALLRKQEEVEHMARIAERERISRDLHDLLGHSLSMIALKAELAGKLADRDAAACRNEIRDIETAARKALSEVRAAVTGYRHSGFSGALASARASLVAANVQLHEQVQRLSLPPAKEHVLALALREAVTNVVRHAGASRCSLGLTLEQGDVVLRVADDGANLRDAADLRHGNGLSGMRERVASVGGQLSIKVESGMALELRVPVEEV